MAQMVENAENTPSETRREGSSFTIREAKEEDLETMAFICYSAFKAFNESVGVPFEADFPSVEKTTELFQYLMKSTKGTGFAFAAVDDATGQLVGSTFLHHDSEVYSVGPISVDPNRSSKGAGKAIMTSLINRAKDEGATSIRLTQAAHNTKSFSLYLGLGFIPHDCFASFNGAVKAEQAAAAAYALGFAPNTDADVRFMEEADVGPCAELFKKTMGYDRSNDIQSNLGPNSWVVLTKSGEILAYTTGFDIHGHTVAQSDRDFITLFNGIISKAELPFLLHISTRLQPRLASWALASKFSLLRHHWIMVIGEYQPPQDNFVYLPSILH